MMLSRRSSTSCDGDAASIDLEYDDIPLDLVATSDDITLEHHPLNIEQYKLDIENANQQETIPMLTTNWNLNWDTADWKLPPATAISESEQPGFGVKRELDSDVVRRKEKNIVRQERKTRSLMMCEPVKMAEDIITDYGRRSWCNYEVNACPRDKDVFVASEKRLSQLIEQTAQATVQHHSLLHDNAGGTNSLSSDESNSSHDGGGGEGRGSVGTTLTISCRERCHRCCISWRSALTAQHPLPAAATRGQRLRHALQCPPHGVLSRYLTMTLGVALLWILTWALLGDDALFGSGATLFILYVCGYISGNIVSIIKLPPYAGNGVFI